MNTKIIYVPVDLKDQSFKLIKENFDYKLDYKLYEKDNNGPKIYQELFNIIQTEDKKNKLITLSKDKHISLSTISAINEKFLIRNDNSFSSDLRIIYISQSPHFNLNLNNSNSDNIVSTLMGLTDTSLISHKLLLKPEQIIFLGINENITPCDQIMLLDQFEIKYFTLQRIKKLNIEKVLNFILKEFENHPIHLVFNLDSIQYNIAPSVENNNNNYGLSEEDFQKIILILKSKICSIDITNYSFNNINNFKDVMTSKITKILMKEIMVLKEIKFNIFTEDSRFLIYRSIEQENDQDLGWYILRFIPLELREQILKKINDDDIINLTTSNDTNEEIDIYITSTSYSEQENLSYFTAQSITDKCLFPSEKMVMLFELINTPNNNIE